MSIERVIVNAKNIIIILTILNNDLITILKKFNIEILLFISRFLH